MQACRALLAELCASCIVVFARFVTAVRASWAGVEPREQQRVYFANHCSHGDFVLLWTVLPPRLRAQTRPVAGADYWLTSPIRRFIGCDVFRSVLIQRDNSKRQQDPVQQMASALDEGDSLIVFPEGTRNTSDETLLPFKSGLFHLANARPDVELVPVWINNLNRVLPKGEIIPVPLACTVVFGAPLCLAESESKDHFLQRAQQALLRLANSQASS
ncbi:MAG: lysophospholipid acyltransferase family protein [Granulosicoccus sp.]